MRSIVLPFLTLSAAVAATLSSADASACSQAAPCRDEPFLLEQLTLPGPVERLLLRPSADGADAPRNASFPVLELRRGDAVIPFEFKSSDDAPSSYKIATLAEPLTSGEYTVRYRGCSDTRTSTFHVGAAAARSAALGSVRVEQSLARGTHEPPSAAPVDSCAPHANPYDQVTATFTLAVDPALRPHLPLLRFRVTETSPRNPTSVVASVSTSPTGAISHVISFPCTGRDAVPQQGKYTLSFVAEQVNEGWSTDPVSVEAELTCPADSVAAARAVEGGCSISPRTRASATPWAVLLAAAAAALRRSRGRTRGTRTAGPRGLYP